MTSTPQPDPVAIYDLKAAVLADSYESISAADVHGPLADLIPSNARLAMVRVGACRSRRVTVAKSY
jgi:hypothetical protein